MAESRSAWRVGGVNLYAYVENSPLHWLDPFGLQNASMGNPSGPWAPLQAAYEASQGARDAFVDRTPMSSNQLNNTGPAYQVRYNASQGFQQYGAALCIRAGIAIGHLDPTMERNNGQISYLIEDGLLAR